MTGPVYEPGTAFAAAVDVVRAGAADADQAAADLLPQLTDAELLWLLDGDLPMLAGLRETGRRYNLKPYGAGRVERLGIPGIRFTDGPRGVAVGTSRPSACWPPRSGTRCAPNPPPGRRWWRARHTARSPGKCRVAARCCCAT